MKKLLLLIVAAMFAAVTLPACSDDDKGDNNGPSQGGNSGSSQIVGTWELVHIHFESNVSEGDIDDVQGDGYWHILSFKTDGTCSIVYPDDKNTGSYLIEGNMVMIRWNGGAGSETDVIKTLSATTLALETVVQDGEFYTKEVYTYKRV